MTLAETRDHLRTCGTAQNRKIYARHGVADEMFGVSYANLKALARKIKTDHTRAAALWESGNHDASVLATTVADPGRCASRMLDRWARRLNNYVIADAFGSLVARTPHASAKADLWGNAKSDHLGQTGWTVVAQLAANNACPDAYFADKLAVIERDIHRRPNRTRHAMNMALWAIGISRPTLRLQALAVAKAIGKGEVDHGETSCQMPDAAAYIAKAVARKPPKKKARWT